MTDLTAGCTRTGPHPATRTELEARAEGHYAGKLLLKPACVICGEDGWERMAFHGTNIPEAHANAAYAYLAWTSFEALVKAAEMSRDVLSRIQRDVIQHESPIVKLVIDHIDSALSLSRGGTDKKEGA